ncbi:hypothetical protein KBA73_04705 [Patescibacteria group bacterium]|nr:hypothetical protein [Patescibacteria group bacterium]
MDERIPSPSFNNRFAQSPNITDMLMFMRKGDGSGKKPPPHFCLFVNDSIAGLLGLLSLPQTWALFSGGCAVSYDHLASFGYQPPNGEVVDLGAAIRFARAASAKAIPSKKKGVEREPPRVGVSILANSFGNVLRPPGRSPKIFGAIASGNVSCHVIEITLPHQGWSEQQIMDLSTAVLLNLLMIYGFGLPEGMPLEQKRLPTSFTCEDVWKKDSDLIEFRPRLVKDADH